jgi:hypothetical protein
MKYPPGFFVYNNDMRKRNFLFVGSIVLAGLAAGFFWLRNGVADGSRSLVVDRIQETETEEVHQDAGISGGASVDPAMGRDVGSEERISSEKAGDGSVPVRPDLSVPSIAPSDTSSDKGSESGEASAKESGLRSGGKAAAYGGDTSEKGSLKIIDRLMDSGYAVPAKPRTIDTVILHSSYDALGDDPYSVKGIVKEYEEYGVSAHYLIARDGTIYRLVKEENVAYHAGVSRVPDGRTNVNDFSVGIELVNTKTGEYSDEQYAAVKKLIASLKKKYDIGYVLGHDDIAAGRKTDPWNFDWRRI